MLRKEFINDLLYHNTIDVWIKVCEENNIDWFNVDLYLKFIEYLKSLKIKMDPMNLCIKEAGGLFERSAKKAKFLDELKKVNKNLVFIIKFNEENKRKIKDFFNTI